MIEATFGYQMTSSSSNLSSSAISILTATATSAAGNLSNQNRAFFLKWLVRI
ncbi:unnamed protein product, partial [Rotaria magnacalcarata]